MSTPNEPTFGPSGQDTHHEPDLLLQPIPKATRFRRKLVYALLGTAIAAVSVIFTYGLMKSNHHDIIGAGKAHENTAATVPDISNKLPKNYSDVSDLAAKQRNADTAKAGTAGQAGVQQSNVNSPTPAARNASSQPNEQQVARSASVFFRQDPASSAAVRQAPTPAAPGTAIGSDAQPANKAQSPYGDQPLPAEAQGGLTVQKNAFLASVTTTKDYVSQPLQHPRSRFEVKAGSLISAALVTAINSDLPGEVVAQVTENVFDTVSGRYLLIPQGSRVIGKYDSLLSYGQDRALVVWNRLILPNGNSIDLEGMNGTDETGTAGLQDETNHHRWAFAGALAVSTVMSFGPSVAQAFAQRATTGSSTNIYTQPSTTLGTQTSQVGENLLNRELNRPNTLTIRQGWPLRILLNRDMVLEAYK
jgi:type IV secretory pathway VirB10-like protein